MDSSTILEKTLTTIAYQFGPKTITAIPDAAVRAFGIADGEPLEVIITNDGILMKRIGEKNSRAGQISSHSQQAIAPKISVGDSYAN